MKKYLLIIFITAIFVMEASPAPFGSGYVFATNGKPKSGVMQQSQPSKYQLYQNYPNPFNPETIIKFYIPKEEFVTLKLYSIIGQEVKTIISENKSEGTHEVKIDGSNLAGGIYLYSITAGEFSQTKRMILMK